MKKLDSNYYVEVRDKRYRTHRTENILLGLREETITLRFQYQVQNVAQIRKSQKVIRNNNDKLVVKKHPKNKKQAIFQQ